MNSCESSSGVSRLQTSFVPLVKHCRHQLTNTATLWPLSPGATLPVRPLSGAAAVSDVVSIDGDQFLAALRRLLLLPELVVLPTTFVLPQLPVSAFRSEDDITTFYLTQHQSELRQVSQQQPRSRFTSIIWHNDDTRRSRKVANSKC